MVYKSVTLFGYLFYILGIYDQVNPVFGFMCVSPYAFPDA